MTAFPRYFAFGSKYVAPNPYYRVNDEFDAELIVPGIHADEDTYVAHGLAYFLELVEARRLTETTPQKIKAAIARWSRSVWPDVM